MTLRVAIVGCGKIADGHVEEIQKMPARARVVACCDLEPLMAEQLATRYRLPAHYHQLDEMLARERPDVVHVTTPPAAHLALAQQVLAAGAHVLVEKPLAPTLADAREIVAAARARGRLLTVGWTYRFDPPALAVRELLGRGVIGDPVHVESYYGYSLASPFGVALMADPEHWVHRLPGKLAQNNLDHVLSKLPELLPDDRPDEEAERAPLEGLRLEARGWARRRETWGDARDELVDEVRVMLGGRGPSAYGTFSAHAKPTGHYLRVFGTKGTVHASFTSRTVTLEAEARLPSAIGRLLPAFEQGVELLREGAKNVLRFAQSDFHYFAGLSELLSRFYAAVEGGGPPPIPYREIVRVAAMMDEIVRQVPQGARGRVA